MTGLSSVVKGTGPALLLVHGAGGSVLANYGPVLGTLARHFTVIAPDLPGAGGSPEASGPLELDELADDLVEVAVRAGHESIFVSGYSMGCAIAVTAAARHPRRVRGLVLSAPFTKIDAGTKTRIDEWRSLLGGPSPDLSRFILSVMCSGEYLARFSESRVTHKARQVLCRLLPQGEPKRDVVAQALHLSQRTLQRRLQEEGTSFQALLDDTRRELAEQYLAQPAMTLLQIAYLLGFADPSNFFRAFRRWFDATPGEYRAARFAKAVSDARTPGCTTRTP